MTGVRGGRTCDSLAPDLLAEAKTTRVDDRIALLCKRRANGVPDFREIMIRLSVLGIRARKVHRSGVNMDHPSILADDERCAARVPVVSAIDPPGAKRLPIPIKRERECHPPLLREHYGFRHIRYRVCGFGVKRANEGYGLAAKLLRKLLKDRHSSLAVRAAGGPESYDYNAPAQVAQ